MGQTHRLLDNLLIDLVLDVMRHARTGPFTAVPTLATLGGERKRRLWRDRVTSPCVGSGAEGKIDG
ncbi:hypothetical protein CHELA40_30215 [Chelatococcus asaccharovorans]|nr:hypothetical protein CHELA17_40201 [Chelatococcus asaccharovorans]CAH1688374.1 hypothetical protein CHELA40_30215 [Chelatococcus asaccharovorans]